MTSTSPWIATREPLPRPRLRLFCLPYAGGGANVFQSWATALPDGVELMRVQLPGRETRFVEPALDNIDALLPPLTEGLAPFLDRPFAVFGHSFGAIVAYELVRTLAAHGRPAAALYPSGHRAPHLPLPRPPVAHLDDARFVQELRWMKGTPEELIANEELLEIVLPTVRADVRVWETYRHRPGDPLDCPMTVFGGADDEVATPGELEPWRQHTAGRFALHLLPGDHFFLHPQQSLLLRHLNEDLRRVLAET